MTSVDNFEKKIKKHCCKKEDIKAVYLFGSRADGTYRSDSDIDLSIMVNPELDKVEAFDLKLDVAVELEELLGIKVDVVVFSFADLRLKHQILRGQLLVGKKNIYRIEKEAEAVREYLDMKPRYEYYEKLMGKGF